MGRREPKHYPLHNTPLPAPRHHHHAPRHHTKGPQHAHGIEHGYGHRLTTSMTSGLMYKSQAPGWQGAGSTQPTRGRRGAHPAGEAPTPRPCCSEKTWRERAGYVVGSDPSLHKSEAAVVQVLSEGATVEPLESCRAKAEGGRRHAGVAQPEHQCGRRRRVI